ncbi:hypothetical protein AAER44_16695, partial [Acinetobacter baumannii]
NSIKDVSLRSLRKNIGVVQQDVFLFTGTIRDNIICGNPEATEEEMIEAAIFDQGYRVFKKQCLTFNMPCRAFNKHYILSCFP